MTCIGDLDIRLVDDLTGEALPLNEIHQMRCDINNAFSLLFNIKEPRGTDERRPGNHLGIVMNALLRNSGILRSSLLKRAENFRRSGKFALQESRDLKTLGHYIVEQEVLLFRRSEGFLEHLKTCGVDRHRFVCKNI